MVPLTRFGIDPFRTNLPVSDKLQQLVVFVSLSEALSFRWHRLTFDQSVNPPCKPYNAGESITSAASVPQNTAQSIALKSLNVICNKLHEEEILVEAITREERKLVKKPRLMAALLTAQFLQQNGEDGSYGCASVRVHDRAPTELAPITLALSSPFRFPKCIA